MNHKINGNTSKELLYSEYTGTTVVEHVLETLEKKSNEGLHKKIGESFQKRGKSETFERVKNLMSLIENEQDVSNVTTENLKEKSAENEGEIEVVMEVDENSPESNVNAWFLLKLPKEKESKCSDDDDLEKKSPARRILDLSDSSDTSDDELEQNFPIITNGFLLNDNDSSNFSSDEKELNPSVSSKPIRNSTNFYIDDSSDNSNGSEGNFPVIVNKFVLSDTNSSNSSSNNDKQSYSHSSNAQNSSNCVNDDSSNSSDIKSEQNLFFNNVKENLNYTNKDDSHLSIPLSKSKGIIEIPDNVSSEDLNDDFLKQSSSSKEKISSEKKITLNFVLNGSSNPSFDDCEQNGSFHNGETHMVKEDCLDSPSVMGDVLKSEKLTALSTGSSKHLLNENAGCFFQTDLKRKFSIIENEIPNSCDTKNPKRVARQKILNF